MPKYLIALTNPSSPDKEDAFNAWYNTYHVPEVCALDGFVGAKRFKADATQFADPDFSYAVIYEVEDAATALASLAQNGASLTPSDAISPEYKLLFVEEIFSYDK
ncbi:MAG: hypothetical protein E6R02_09625 [Gammaproteobacteria bacterium]|jgi:hypothetical protein|nr:MAG: hypothetical protein E6R02_09625 [Gammaproteobacteria bacterium]